MLKSDLTLNQKLRKQEETIKALKKELANQKHYYESIFDVLPANVFLLDRNNICISCNQLQAISVGCNSIDEVVGRNFVEFVPEDIGNLITQENNKIMESGKPYITEDYAELVGKPAVYETYKMPVKNRAGEVIGLAGVSFDITKRKKLEEELIQLKIAFEEAEQAKTQFIMNMSHDIRTPFTGIISTAELLKHQETDRDKQELISFILQSSSHLLKFINNIIDEISIANKTQEIRKELFDPKQLIQDIRLLLSATIHKKNLVMNVYFPVDYPELIMTDRISLYEILVNIIGNAVKFTNEGQIDISVSFELQEVNDTRLMIVKVKDTGIGIPTDKKEAIFGRFCRLSPAYEGKYDGLGLGLSNSQQLVEKLGGKINVESIEHQGSTFTVETSVSLQEIAVNQNICVEKAIADALPEKSIALEKQRFLVVEDNPIAGKVAKSMLTKYFDCVLDIAMTGAEGITLANQHRYDLIILDVGLPDLSGFDVANRVRASSELNKNTSMIGLTAHHNASFSELDPDNTLALMLEKPLSMALCEKIAHFLKR